MSCSSSLENCFRVYRCVYGGCGWHGRFQVMGEAYVRYFADAHYGSPEAAKAAAHEFATENWRLHEELLSLRRRFEVRRNSRTGVPGIARYEGKRGRGPYWLAYWDDEKGRRVNRRFAISRFGEEGARQLATEARERAVAGFLKRYEEVLALLGLQEMAPPPKADESSDSGSHRARAREDPHGGA